MKYSIFSIPILGILLACTHDPVIPDVPQISFKDQVQPIIVSNCGTSGCHDGRHEFALQTYDEITNHIEAGNAQKSKLYKVITKLWLGTMPPAGPLADEQIRIIYVWIEQGAKQN